MLTFQDQYELSQDLSSDEDTTNLDLFKRLINVGRKKVEKKLGIYLREREKDFTTVTDSLDSANQEYRLPRGFNEFIDLYVTVGTTQYYAEQLIQDPEWWRVLNSTTTQTTSDFLRYSYLRGRKILLWPIPSSANTGTLIYRGTSKDLTQADYTTGNVTDLANGGTTVTGSATSWTSSMVGRVFKINSDAEWHYISSVNSATEIELETPYNGSAISGGSESYTIGEVTDIPEDYQELPIWYALWKYFAKFRRDKFNADRYRADYRVGLRDAIGEYGNMSSSQIVYQKPSRSKGYPVNPNNYPRNMS